jgi:dihydrolipoamide dehydrogenase
VSSVDLTIPDIGNFSDVSVVDVLVKAGDVVVVDAPLVTLETDKASMDVPATAAGTITEVLLKRGDKVAKGSLIARLTPAGAAAAAPATAAAAPAAPPPAATVARAAPTEGAGDTVRMPQPQGGAARRAGEEFNRTAQLLVLGSGPGGYTAAFRAADLGLKVTLVERRTELGGVCLNVGCIPSKALLHAAKVIEDADEMSERGIAFGDPEIDLTKLRAWKASVVGKLTGGLRVLAKQRKVEVLRGTGRFVSANVMEVMDSSGSQRVRFDQCIIAAGSEPVRLPGMPQDPRVMDSTDALELPEFSGGLLVVGGGIIGLELACVFDALGSRVSVVELTGQLMLGCDPDLVRPLERRIRSRYQQILLNTRVADVNAEKDGLRVSFAGDQVPAPQLFERVLVAVGRVPNGRAIGAEHAGVNVSERGFVPVDK